MNGDTRFTKIGLSADIISMAADQITSTPQPSSVKIQATELVKQFRPELSNGDIIKLLVRSNPDNSQGLLYYRGLLIPALLPDTLKPGDTIQAKVGVNGEQLKLQILETISKTENSLLTTLGKIPQLTTQISNELNNLLREIKLGLSQGTLPAANSSSQNSQNAQTTLLPTFLQSPQDTTVSVKGTPLANPQIPVEQLIVSSVVEEGPLVQGDQILTQLKQITDPVVLERIKQSITQFKANVADVDLKAADQSTKNLAKLIATLKILASEGPAEPDQFKALIMAIVDESKKISPKLTPRGTPALQSELMPVLEKAMSGNKEALKAIIVNSEKFRDAVIHGTKLAEVSLQQLHQFEQLIDSQQRLTTLNPLMHTLGEPAFILFPFLVHGLLKHSEVSISPPAPDEVDEDEQGNGGNAKRYQRVTVTVPLNNLGNVVVDVAHRPGEVLIRFSVRDASVKQLLMKRMGELDQALNGRGFGSLEYWIAVNGDNQSPSAIFNSALFLSSSDRSEV